MWVVVKVYDEWENFSVLSKMSIPGKEEYLLAYNKI